MRLAPGRGMNESIHRVLLASLILAAGVASCGQEDEGQFEDQATGRTEDSLRAIVAQTFAAIEARDAAGALQFVSPDIVYIGDGMIVTGRDSLVRLAERAFGEWRSATADVEIKSVSVLAADIAVMTWESRVSAALKDGSQVPFGGVTTAIFQRQDGQWRIIQQQQCAPMPPEVDGTMSTTRAMPSH
jgi:uncharacterized protein (TIGR02246 family)